jgi:hypothetical protein
MIHEFGASRWIMSLYGPSGIFETNGFPSRVRLGKFLLMTVRMYC